jgi:uncharacterized C2H2 Zn-finger protein
MIKSYGVPDNAELFFKCSQCGNMFEPQKKGCSQLPHLWQFLHSGFMQINQQFK